ncbi:MAG: T9SS type A sorting domain-containing protein [Bacteroidetes bacterium]|nr:T9SS type A sorting domain-containing protein [Bacteroidota bacterium]
MRLKHLCAWMAALCMLFTASTAYATLTVNGPTLICVGNSAVYTFTSSTTYPGATYRWTLSSPIGTIISGGVSATVTWSSIGRANLKVYVDTGVSGTVVDSGMTSVTTFAKPKPFITTNQRVACQAFDTSAAQPGPEVLDDKNGCVKVCAGSTVTYYANGGTSGDHLQWVVSGGSIIGSSTSSSVAVSWSTLSGGGSIELVDTSTGGCFVTYGVCIDIIAKPHASFFIDSNRVPVSSYAVCIGGNALFQDQSTVDSTSSIVAYRWIFGDGSYSSQKNPSHKYMTAGVDTAKLVVTNACGCTDTFKTVITVNASQGPRVECASIVCQGDVATYYTPDSCPVAVYNWSVSAGNTIISRSTSGASITVQWNTANSDGYGTVSLTESVPCAIICNGTTTVKVPIVQSHPTIKGVFTLCTGVPYQFMLPLWPATQYDWGVINDPSAIISGHHNSTVAVKFTNPGTYKIHAWYKNSIKLCGGDTTFTVTVQNPPTISGPVLACAGSTDTFTLSGSYRGKWICHEPDLSIDSGSGNRFIIHMGGAGTSVLSVTPYTTPTFCPPDPYTVTVAPFPPAVDSIKGDTIVCAGHTYRYKAMSHIPGYTFKWRLIGSGTLYETTGDSVTVLWSSSAGELGVRRVDADSPYCEGNELLMEVTGRPDSPIVYGPTIVCANSTTTYTLNTPDGPDVKVDWDIWPDGAGSIVKGYEGTTVQVAWNYSSGLGLAVVEGSFTYCGVTKTGGLWVDVNYAPAMSIPTILPDSIGCNGSNYFNFGAESGSDYYTWDFGDGTTATTPTLNAYHSYTLPPGHEGLFIVKVTGHDTTDTPTICPSYGTGFRQVYVVASDVKIHTPDPLGYCGTPFSVSDTLYAANTGEAASSYTWYKGADSIGTGTNIYVVDTGLYNIKETDVYGCLSYDTLHIGYSDTCHPPCSGTVSATFRTACNTVYATGTNSGGGTSPHWHAPGGVVADSLAASTTITYNKPGYYLITFSETFSGGCVASATYTDSVPLIGSYYTNITCPTTVNKYGLELVDNSGILPTWTRDSTIWKLVNGGITINGSGQIWNGSLASGTYAITETVYAHCGSVKDTCVSTGSIYIPIPITGLSIRDSFKATCNNVPNYFRAQVTPSTVPISRYLWLFNNSAGGFETSVSILPDPEIAFPTGAASGFGLPILDTLIVTDSIGCEWGATAKDSVYSPDMADVLNVLPTAYWYCPGTIDTLYATASRSDIVRCLWFDGSTATRDYVSGSGYYDAIVYDHLGCWNKITTDVNIIPVPDLTIHGRTSYCDGEAVTLQCFPNPAYVYWWLRDSTVVADSGYVVDGGLSPGTYVYRLVACYYTCTPDTSAPDTVIIHPSPAAPNITNVTMLNCPEYQIKLTAADTGHEGGFKYNWSDGHYGAIDTVYNGGAYRVFATDTFGCTSHRDTLMPYSTDSWLAWFPTGCYPICTQSIKDSLYGPPTTFTYWDWMKNGTTYGSPGTNSTPKPVTFNSSGSYRLALNNGMCLDTSDTMAVTLLNCSSGCPVLNHTPGNHVICDSANPAAYVITNISFVSPPPPGTKMTVGVNGGPIVPFSITASGATLPAMHFTTLHTPPYNPIFLEITYTMPTGQICYDTLSLTAPYPCGWAPERQANPDPGQPLDTLQQVATGMVVYPNPATKTANVNYNFGYTGNVSRHIQVYDMTGKMVAQVPVTDMDGTISVPVANLAAGTYVVRMEEEGKTIQVAHLAITH